MIYHLNRKQKRHRRPKKTGRKAKNPSFKARRAV